MIVCPLSLAGPVEMFVAQSVTVCVPASSSTSSSAPPVNDGASLIPSTVIVKVLIALESSPPLAVPPLSLAWTETVVDPLAFAASV